MESSYAIPIQAIQFKSMDKYGIELRMARADQVHNLASGNKIYKLRPIIEYAKANNFIQILSFGGAFSNHIHALALMGKKYGIGTVGIIRGEQEYSKNPTLKDAQEAGMSLQFVDRAEYKQRDDTICLNQLKKRFPHALIIPEGGSSQLAIQGCAQMAKDINNVQKSDVLTVASGSGATAAGLACGLGESQSLSIYAVLKDESIKERIQTFIENEDCLEDEKKQVTHSHSKYSIQQADFGGYAKFDKTLLAFILDWLEQTGILLDPIYTSKMCMRVIQQIEAGEFTNGQSITLIHTGGLQGWRGMEKRVVSLGGELAWNKIMDNV